LKLNHEMQRVFLDLRWRQHHLGLPT